MNEQIVQMGPIWVLAGLSAGWLAEAVMHRRGHGLMIDLTLGVGAGVVGGSVFLASAGPGGGMPGMFVVGFVGAAAVVLSQRLWWPSAPGARERRAGVRLVELRGGAPGGAGAGSGQPTGARPASSRALARIAATGIYLLRGVSLDLQRAARARAVRERTTLRQVLLKALSEYAAGTWTPRPDDKRPAASASPVHVASR
jgi:uncharacterized membrane protein YeaQ/YmgE (transglycosylase-associated protein family)